MSDINFKHYNGDISTWQNNIDSGVYADDIVFGRTWEQDPSSALWKMKLSIYAGKDDLGHDYIYDIADYEQFVYLQNLLSVDSSNFTNELFRESLENYIANSSVFIQTTQTQVDITSAKQVGYVNKGAIIPEGTTVEDLVKMIFTKVLGLQGESAPSITMSGISKDTMEVGDTISNKTVTATYSDGYWINEENWKNEHSGQSDTQMYGCVVTGYSFSGMGDYPSQPENSIVIPTYTIKKGVNKVTCMADYQQSINIPVNQEGKDLSIGIVNDTTHYKPQEQSSATASTAIITGDYKYWIGYTTVIGSDITRAIIDNAASFIAETSGFSGTSINYATQFNIPQHNYVTIIVPSNMELKHIEDSFNNSVLNKYIKYEISGGIIGLDPGKNYNVYQEWSEAEAGVERKNIKVS